MRTAIARDTERAVGIDLQFHTDRFIRQHQPERHVEDRAQLRRAAARTSLDVAPFAPAFRGRRESTRKTVREKLPHHHV